MAFTHKGKFPLEQNKKLQAQFTQQLAKRIKQLRKQQGVTQEELSFRAGLGLSYLGHLERGLHNPRSFVCWKIANALNITLSEFLEGF